METQVGWYVDIDGVVRSVADRDPEGIPVIVGSTVEIHNSEGEVMETYSLWTSRQALERIGL